MITKIENYFLNQKVEEAPDLIECDSEQYVMFEMAGMKRMLKDEKIYNGHDISFLGSVWNTVIGATQGKIYKISIQHINPDRNESNLLFQKTFEYLEKEMGIYSKQRIPSEMFIWNFPGGNVILHLVSKFNTFSINLFLTSSSIRSQKLNLLHILFKNQLNKFIWNPLENSDEDNLRWAWLRAIEWGIFPAFLSIPAVPILLIYFDWWKVLGSVIILTILWSFVRYKFVNLQLAQLGVWWVLLKWVSSPVSVIILIVNKNYLIAILALLWPLLAAYNGLFVGGTQIGVIQKMFMEKFGYQRKI